jgi:hypothetical protein
MVLQQASLSPPLYHQLSGARMTRVLDNCVC